MTQIICGECLVPYRLIESGVIVIQYDSQGKPIQTWAADELQCPTCKTKVVSDFGAGPFLTPGSDRFAAVKGFEQSPLLRRWFPNAATRRAFFKTGEESDDAQA